MLHILNVSHTILTKKGEKCNWAFASVPGHPIWIMVMTAVSEAIFQELKNQLDGEEKNGTYKPLIGKTEVLSMTGPLIMTNIINLYLHQVEHVATDSYRQIGWAYDVVG